jgi:hypothetical protein
MSRVRVSGPGEVSEPRGQAGKPARLPTRKCATHVYRRASTHYIRTQRLCWGELTYLSIVLTIGALEKAGKLVRYEPTVPRDPHPQGPRNLWLTPATRGWCFPEGSHPDTRIKDEALASLHDQMNAFVRGDFLEHGIDIRRLCPQQRDVWEIKSLLTKRQLRVFGWFVLPKWFVAVHRAVRDHLEKVRGPKWDRAIQTTAEAREMLVGSVDWYDVDPAKYLQNPR